MADKDDVVVDLTQFAAACPLGMIVTDADGVIRSFNAAAEQIFGHRAEDVHCQDVSILFGVPSRALDRYRRLRGECMLPCEMRAVRADGTSITVELTVTELSTDGQSTFVGVVRDVTARKEAERDLQRKVDRMIETNRLAELGSFEIMLDTYHVIWSDVTFQLFGRDPTLGPPSYDEILSYYHPDDQYRMRESREQSMIDGLPFICDLRVRQGNGSYRYLRIARHIEKGLSGKPIRVYGTVQDIHDRKMAEIAVAEGAARLAEAQRTARMGSFEYRFASGEVVWSDETFRLLGRDPSLGPPAYEEILTFYHPDDVAAAVVSREEAMAGGGASFATDTRVRQRDGSYRYCRIVRSLVQTADGRPDRLNGVVLDIHDRKMVEIALKESEARLAEAQQTAHMGSYEFNYSTGELLWSDETYRLFDRDPAEGKVSYEEVMAAYHPEDLEKLLALRKRSLESGEQYELDLRVKQKDGAYRWCHSITRPIRDNSGKSLRIVGTLLDIHDRKTAEENLRLANSQLAEQKAGLESANDRLRALATTDALTGLANHRAFQERLANEWNRSNRYLNPFSVILLDIDRFKMYNDSYGHPQGDRILRTVADVLQGAARDSDTVARYGGEEFVILLPETSRDQACMAAERFRSAIEQHGWPLRRITASFGVATVNMTLDTGQTLIDAADRAMYAAKRAGANCVRHADAMSSLLDADVPFDQKLTIPPLPIMPEALLAVGSDLESLLLKAYDGTISSWSRLLNIRDEETEGHSDRVADMTVRLAKHLGFNERETMNARWGALLHDIGKLGIPDSILLKPGPLTEEEWDIMRRHPVIADDMLSPISILAGALDIPRSHHERWDGTGYPQGLAAEAIPLAARLFAVVDVWDALRSKRPYRDGWPDAQVRQYLADHSGSHFDPRAVEAFLQIIDAAVDSVAE